MSYCLTGFRDPSCWPNVNSMPLKALPTVTLLLPVALQISDIVVFEFIISTSMIP